MKYNLGTCIFSKIGQGLCSVFPDKEINGCAYHWTQAVWHKTQNTGLQPADMERDGIYYYLRKLYALPFLPSEHISEAFNKLQEKASSDSLLPFATMLDQHGLKALYGVPNPGQYSTRV